MRIFVRYSSAGGGVLLEVLMALALILGASSVITGGLQSAIDSVERMRNEVHGVNLAVSVISRIQMGMIEAERVESQNFDAPFAEWSYDIEIEEVNTETMMDLSGSESAVPELVKVEVAIHDPKGLIVNRMTQFVVSDAESGSYSPSDGGEGYTVYGN